MALVKVGGVPEHFNVPWRGLGGVDFAEVRQGSGKMLKGLQDGEYDVIVALTESLVAAVENGEENVKLLAMYVDSPLTWAINVRKGTTSVDHLDGKVFGISRYSSGSHLMAQVLANAQKWENPVRFEVCDDFAGLRDALKSERIDAFLWEIFTCRPFEQRGDLHVLDGLPTPWPCFAMATTPTILETHGLERLKQMTSDVLLAADAYRQDAGGRSSAIIQQDFGLTVEDAKAWLGSVRYSEAGLISRKVLECTRDTLLDVGIISAPKDGNLRDVSSYLADPASLIDS